MNAKTKLDRARAIIHDEVEGLKRPDANHRLLILQAARKLDSSDMYSNKQICSRLSELLSHYKRYIRKVLPDEYKRSYSRKSYHPQTKIQELLLRYAKSCFEFSKILKETLRRYKKDPEFATKCEKCFSTELKPSLLEEVNEWAAQIALCKSLSDRRKKLTLMEKVLIKEYQKHYSVRSLAKMVGVSPEWIKTIQLDSDGSVERARSLMERFLKRACGENFELSNLLIKS